MVFEICKRTDRETNKHTYIHTCRHADHNTSHPYGWQCNSELYL